MDSRVSLITLVTPDLAASRRFYVDGLGWEVVGEAEGEVVFVRLSPTQLLSLWDAPSSRGEIGDTGEPAASAIVLAHNVSSPAAVDAVVADVVRAGGTVMHEPRRREWGGYSGYVADPVGFRWEIAFNPGDVGVELMRASGLA